MDILEISKDNIIYNEGDEVDSIFYLLEGELEAYKMMSTTHTHKGTQVEYIPFQPGSQVAEQTNHFWEEYPNLVETFPKKDLEETGQLKFLGKSPFLQSWSSLHSRIEMPGENLTGNVDMKLQNQEGKERSNQLTSAIQNYYSGDKQAKTITSKSTLDVEKFKSKPNIEHFKLLVTKAKDFIGLEEIMMEETKRFTKVV